MPIYIGLFEVSTKSGEIYTACVLLELSLRSIATTEFDRYDACRKVIYKESLIFSLHVCNGKAPIS